MPDFSIADVFTTAGLAALGQVLMIDLMLAGDNVVVLGTLTAGLAPRARRRVLALGVGVALVCLVSFAFFATRLLQVPGLLFAGGLLLLWVAWRLYRELRRGGMVAADVQAADARPAQSVARVAAQVAVADLSMSLDNVLAVAGAAREHPTVLFFGLGFSVTVMAVAANLIAALIQRHQWIAYLGLAVILYVAGSMLYEGVVDPESGVQRFWRR